MSNAGFFVSHYRERLLFGYAGTTKLPFFTYQSNNYQIAVK